MKVKIIQSMSEKKVERMVNEFISHNDIKVIELQYSATSVNFSVMVIYEDVDPAL